MISKIDIAEKKLDNLITSGLSKQLKSIISTWARFAIDYYKDWDNKPNCGHFFGGCYNYGVETSFTMTVLAVLSTIGEYDEIKTGKSKNEINDMVIKSIRYLCYTHFTGPIECVREESKNPRTSGTKWGSYGDNFFTSSQTGVSVSMLGLSAWLLWEHIDDETRRMVHKLIVFYADKYSAMEPGSGTYNDTQCEENAWTSLGIAVALYMFPNHPNNEIWLDAYIRWSLNSVTTYKDKLENEYDKVSHKSRGGFKYNDKTYGVSSVTFHPDFTTENHGYVHPDYMGAGIILNVSSVIFPLIAGLKPIGSIFFNCENLYNKVLKPFCGFDGNPIPVQGQDWFYHRHHNKIFMHGVMNVLFNDREAARFERNCIEIIEGRQNSNKRGCLLEEKGELLEVTPGMQSAFDMEYGSIRTVLLTYLLHTFKGDGLEPVSQDELMRSLRGTYMYPYGGVYIHRTEKSFSSFTTRCSIMGLNIPVGGLWDITSDFQSFTGIIREKEADDTYFKQKKINWNDIGIECVRKNISEYSDGFSIIAEVPRANDRISQMSSFSALEDGRVVYVEKLKANSDIFIDTLETGKIGIGNENFKGLPKLAKSFKDIYFNGKQERFYGNYDGENTIIYHNKVKYINVDNKIGYLIYGSHGTEYTNRHEYPKWKGLEDTLILNKREPFFMESGKETEIFAVVSLPNTDNSKTEKEYESSEITYQSDDLFVIRNNKNRVSVNFSDKKTLIEENSTLKNDQLYIFRGRTFIQDMSVKNNYYVGGFESKIDMIEAVLLFGNNTQNLKIICADGLISILNSSDRDTTFTLEVDDIRKDVFLGHGNSIELFT
ncbi:MAG: hypothetical protein KAH14_08530 [Clostridiales bacterium]|nr:hypothetical protein [Clostridiales bacterium]